MNLRTLDLGDFLARYQPEWLERLRLGAPFWVGPTGMLGLTIYSSWKHKAIFVHLVAKLDESGTDSDSPVMTMAGYVGRLEQWNRFDRKLKKALKKAGLEYFHTVDHKKSPIAEKVGQIADSCLLFGVAARLSDKDYLESYRQLTWPGKAQPESQYGACFYYCMSKILEIAQNKYPNDLHINFVLESGHRNVGAPNEIITRLKKNSFLEGVECLGTVTTDEKIRSYGLQAADGLATGSMLMDSGKIHSVEMARIEGDLDLDDLRSKTSLKAPIIDIPIDPKKLDELRMFAINVEEYKKAWGRRKQKAIEEKLSKKS